MKTFKVKKSDGSEFNVRFKPIKPDDSYKELGINGSWDKKAEIEINNNWYNCAASRSYKNDKFIPTVKIGAHQKETCKALGIKLQTDAHIIAVQDWMPLYNEFLKENEKEFKTLANAESFNTIRFIYHSSYKFMGFVTDNEKLNDYKSYSDKINSLIDSLEYIKPDLLEAFKTGDNYDDYSTESSFEISYKDIDSIIEMSLPALKEAQIRREKAKAENQKFIKEKEEREENIKNGVIFFHCESKPHNEDLSNVILNRPAPNSGLFTLQHRISNDLFQRIKKFGTYWDAEWLEDCDMFYSSPGWRFSIEAIKELTSTNKVYIDNLEFKE